MTESPSLCYDKGPQVNRNFHVSRGVDVAALVTSLQKDLLVRAHQLTRNTDDAWDLVQDTAVRALAFPGKLSGSESRAWLMRIMYNLFIDRYRSQKLRDRQRISTQLHWPEPEAEADQPPIWTSLPPDAVKMATARLSPTSRIVFAMFAQGVPYADIARKLGISTGTVGTRLLRSRRKLRALLIATLTGERSSPKSSQRDDVRGRITRGSLPDRSPGLSFKSNGRHAVAVDLRDRDLDLTTNKHEQ